MLGGHTLSMFVEAVRSTLEATDGDRDRTCNELGGRNLGVDATILWF